MPSKIPEPKTYYSCRITTEFTASICSTKHSDLNRALAHARKIQHNMSNPKRFERLLVEVVTRILYVDPKYRGNHG